MKVVYEKSPGLTDVPMHYCPGCTHGIIHKLVAETLVELDVLGRAVVVAPVGCAVFAYDYFNCDAQEAAHGRAPAVATGIKRVHPDNIVFTYQGDGDLASIGMGEIVHAAMRGENITVVFVNNAIYGMTGGQMAPTTLVGQPTTTSPTGRSRIGQGAPLRVCEMLATIEAPTYIARVSVHTIPRLNAAKRAIKKAFQLQLENKGFSLVEVLSTCPTNWGLSPVDALRWVEQNMIPIYPLGVYKDVEGGT
jgi:2-oxoglutarate ferredoxin oxidoreductase subunit beta